MICEMVGKLGEKGSGGARDAFIPGVNYVCAKALRIEMLNLTGKDWRTAGEDMFNVSLLNDRVEKPYYHVILSWHEHERPTLDQQFAAMHHLIEALELEEHQIVIGAHGDRNHSHIHAIVNTVHPTKRKVWSKSQDYQRAEQACREIELAQGWTHDRGRFDFDVVEKDGKQTVKLKHAPEAWEKKRQAREEGRRKPSPGDISFRKHHGFESFNQDIPPALKERFARIVTGADSWGALHAGLAGIGLHYQKFGSGARVQLLGSEEYAKASVFGQKFSFKKLEARLGRYKEMGKPPESHPETPEDPTIYVKGTVSEDDTKTTGSTSFQMTLLRRMYTGLHLDDRIAEDIRSVSLDGTPPRVTFRDRSYILDHGEMISASAVTETTIKATVAMAKAKGWSALTPSGPPDYIRGIALEAARAGLSVVDVPEDIQALADEVLAQTRATQAGLDREAEAARKAHLESASDREDMVEENRSEAARQAAEAILDDDTPAPAGPRAPGRPPVKNPQVAPDASKADPGDARRIQHQQRENDWSEIEDMKRTDIGIIARMGGWTDVSRTHPESPDPDVEKRIFEKDGDTIKASLVSGKWLWTSNKTSRNGSVIDLWQQDNPGKSLGDARVAFRRITDTAPPPDPADPAARPVPLPDDHTEARRRWEQAPHIDPTAPNHALDRGIARDTLARFGDQVRAGSFGGIYFAHRNADGHIQGFEQHWRKDGQNNSAHFAKGGRKTLNVLGDPDTAGRMVVLESGLDALALAQIEGRDDTIYASTGGGFGKLTEEALLRLAEGREVVSGFDNDDAGGGLHAQLLALVPEAGREAPPARIENSDAVCKGWLDVLNATRDRQESEMAEDPAQTSDEGPAEPVEVASGDQESSPDDPSTGLPSDEPERPDFS